MKSSHFLRGFQFLAAIFVGLIPAIGAENATVKADRVNVRGKATLQSEVITQLRKGETVSVIEEIPPSPKGGTNNTTTWLKIAMPANTPVWVNASHVEAAAKTVSVRRLNVRGGAGENFSILGTLDKGASVKEIRTVGDWMEIEAPTNTFGFVASELVKRGDSGTPAPSTPAAKPDAPPIVEKLPVKEVETPVTEPVPVATRPAPAAPPLPVAEVPVDTAPKPVELAPPPAPVTPAPSVPVPTTEKADAPLPKRTVSREGIVKRTFSIQAPGEYQLVSIENGKTLNYLVTRKLGFSMDGFSGRKIVVTGEELIDKRWPNTPIIEVETFRIVP